MTPLVPIPTPTRLIHISDLHVGQHRAAERVQRLVRGILDYVAATPQTPPPPVIITGDVTDNGTAEEYATAHDVLRPLVEAGAVVMVCPGNHDVGRLGLTYEPNARERFRAFVRRLTHVDIPTGAFPLVQQHGTCRVICLDSTTPPGLLARGRVGYLQRQALARELEAAQRHRLKTVVALHHHPIIHHPTLVLEDGDALLATLAARCDLILFGHDHTAGEWSGVHGIGRILASCKSTETMRYRRITLFEKRITQEWVAV